MANSSENVHLNRDLSLFDITMIGVGAMIGAGIFVLTGLAAGAAGPALILAFALNGLLTIFTAMVYAELGGAIPEAGGGYLWVKEGLPGSNAFQAGWMSWFAHAVAGGLYASGFGSFLNEALKSLGINLQTFLPQIVITRGFGVIIVLLFLYINYRGASETGTAGNIITVLKVLVILFFVIFGFYTVWKNPSFMDKFTDFSPKGLGGVVTAMGLTFIAFEGYEIIAQAGEEVKDPKRNIPKAIFLSLIIVIPLYILVAFTLIGAVNVPPDSSLPTYLWLGKLGELGLIDAASQFVPLGKAVLLVGAILSTMSALNATTFSSSRVSFAMGRDKNLPDIFGKVHPERKTPGWAILFSGIIMIVMISTLPIHDVAAAADIMFLLLFLQVNVAVITIRKKYGDKLAYGYMTPFFPWIPVIGIFTEFFLAIFLFTYSPIAWYYALVWIGVGFVIYKFYASKREAEKTVTPIVAEERAVADKKKFRVLVPIANPNTAKDLIRLAAKLAQRNDGEIVLLHVQVVPTQTPLYIGREFIAKSRELLDEAIEYGESLKVPVSSVVRVAHKPADAIINTVEERSINYVIMGWRGKTNNPTTLIGRNIDQVGNYANANVIIVENAQEFNPRKILIPISAPTQTKLAVQVAGIFVDTSYPDSTLEIKLVHVNKDVEAGKAVVNQIHEELSEMFDQSTNRVMYEDAINVQHIQSTQILQSITKESAKADIMILESTRGIWRHRYVFGRMHKAIAHRAECPLVLVKSKESGAQFGIHTFFQFFRDIATESRTEEKAELP